MTGKDKSLKAGETGERPTSTEQNSQEVENSSSSRGTSPDNMSEAEKAAAVAALMAGEMGIEADDPGDASGEAADGQVDADGGDGPEGEDGSQGDPAEAPEGKRVPRDLHELAEALDVEPAELYKLQLTTGDGETASLGEMKDAWQGRKSAEREIAKKEADLNSREAGMIAEKQVLRRALSSNSLPPQAAAEFQQAIQHVYDREVHALLDVLPDLRDRAQMDTFRRDVVESYAEFGKKPHEIVFDDHRDALLVRRYAQLKRELAALKKQADPPPPKALTPQGRGRKPPASKGRAAAYSTEAAKLAAVGQLLRGN